MAVYFIRAADGTVKIGRAQNVEQRRRALQTAHAHPLELLRVIDGGPVEEWECHDAFRDARIRGEWFHFREDMLTFEPSGTSKTYILRQRRKAASGGAQPPEDSLIAIVRQVAKRSTLKQREIAEGMGVSPSILCRKLAQHPDDSARFTLDDLERFIEVTGDASPILWLVERYIFDGESEASIQALEAELAALRGAA